MNAQPVRGSSKGLIFCLLIYVIAPATGELSTFGQEPKTVKKVSGSGVMIRTYADIPEASEPCIPTVCEWWKQLREAGNHLLRTGDDRSKKKFILLFVEGIEKSYPIPLANRPAQPMVGSRPGQSPPGVIPRNGKVELLVEVRADGSVGDVKVEKGLGSIMDQQCVQPQRQTIYLPAVKDHTFVTAWQKAVCEFWSQKGM